MRLSPKTFTDGAMVLGVTFEPSLAPPQPAKTIAQLAATAAHFHCFIADSIK
jgi:hypothetical protein